MEQCSNIEGLTIQAAHESTGVTTMVQEACERVEALSQHFVSTSYSNAQPALQDLKEYFARPRVIATGTLNNVRQGQFVSDFTTNDIFSTIFPDGYARLRGVQGLRFKMVFTLQTANTPFHQGVLVLCWQYRGATFERFASNRTYSTTAIPHVRLDLAENTMAQLSVPFMFPGEYFPLDQPIENYGHVALHNLLPPQVVIGMANPTYRLMLHLEDLELFAARPTEVLSVTLQAGKQVKPQNYEFENDTYPFSSALHASSRLVKWVAKGVPSLSSIAGPTSWFLGKAAGVVRYLGYSKPQVQEPVQKIHHVSNVLEHNVDVPTSALVVAPFLSNHLKVDSAFGGTDVDEMALSYVLSQWSQIFRGGLTTDLSAGTMIYGCPIGPQFFWFRDYSASSGVNGNVRAPENFRVGTTAFYPSNLFFWSSMFKQWRGDIEFRFTFAKTKMHGGRVLVTFVPETAGPPAAGPTSGTVDVLVPAQPASLATGPTVDGYSAIFDLRDGNQFTFKVPYVSMYPYNNFFGRTGSLSIMVLDPLQATATVSTSVEFLVEVRAGSDFELAIPTGPLYPANNAFPTVTLQSGKVVSTVKPDVCEVTVGEQVVSAKQLIQIPKWSTVLVSPTTSTLQPFTKTFPYWTYQPNLSAVAPLRFNQMKPECFGFQGNISSCYLYARGGQDINVYQDMNDLVPGADDDQSGTIMYGTWTPVNFANDVVGFTPRNRSSVCATRAATGTDSLHLRFPAYQHVTRIPTGCHNTVDWSISSTGAPVEDFPTNFFSPPNIPRVTFRRNGRRAFVSRSASDDAMLAHYMGPPPLALFQTDESVITYFDPDDVVFNINYT